MLGGPSCADPELSRVRRLKTCFVRGGGGARRRARRNDADGAVPTCVEMISEVAWGVRNLISTQVPAPERPHFRLSTGGVRLVLRAPAGPVGRVRRRRATVRLSTAKISVPGGRRRKRFDRCALHARAPGALRRVS